MKVGIIGAGAVGSACALALVMRGAAREVVPVDRTRDAPGPSRPICATVLRYRHWSNDLTGAALVMITAGVNEKTGGAIDRSDAAGRLKLLDINRGIYESLIPRIVEAASDASQSLRDCPDVMASRPARDKERERSSTRGTRKYCGV